MTDTSQHLEILKQTLLLRTVVPFDLGLHITNSYVEQSLNDGLKVAYWVLLDPQDSETSITTNINTVDSFIVAMPQAFRNITKLEVFISTINQLYQDFEFRESLLNIFKHRLDQYISDSISTGVIRRSMEVAFYNRISLSRPHVMPVAEPGDKFLMVEINDDQEHMVVELLDDTPPPLTFNFRFFFCCHSSFSPLLQEVLSNIPTHKYTSSTKYYQFEADSNLFADHDQMFNKY